MKKKRKIAMVVKKVSFAEAAEEDEEALLYWANLPVKKRLTEAAKWNKRVWQHLLKDKYPKKIELIGGKQTKILTNEDDF